MLRKFLILLCLCSIGAAAEFALKDGDTVVFYGDSITDQRLYTTFVESYVLTRFPKLHIRFVHSGWGGDRVIGGGGGPIQERLRRDVIRYKPTVVTIMLGMNDGRYKPYDPETFNTFASGYLQIIRTLKMALPGVRITVIQPSPYDDVTRQPLFEPGYNAVLVQYGEFVRQLAKQENLRTADLNTSVVAALTKANASDPSNAQKIIPDRVHPGPAGHLLMAEALLKAWDAPATVSDVEIDTAGNPNSKSTAAEITGLQPSDRGVSWAQTDAALPVPVDWTDPLVKLAVDSSDFLTGLDREMLHVTGLAPGTYKLNIDGSEIASYSADQLARGVNLAIEQTAMLKQALEVAHLTTDHNNVHFARWRTIQVPMEKYHFTLTSQVLADLDALEDEIVRGQQAAAQPKPHRYELIRSSQ